MKKYFILFILFINLVYLSLIAIADQEKDDIKKDYLTRALLMKTLLESENGRFILEGSILDSEGRPLDGVTMAVDTSKWHLTQVGMSSSKTWTETVDKKFKLDLDGYCYVSLIFSKDGYYKTKRYDYSTQADEYNEKIARGEKVIVSKKDLVITMYKIKELSELTNFYGGLTFSIDGSGTILDLNNPPSKAFKKVTNVKIEKKDYPDGIFIMSDVTSSGIASEERETFEARSIFTYPNRITLISADDQGGFIKFDPKENVPVNIQMREAPQEGYKKELVITSDNILKQVEATFPNDLGHFFFKVNGRYGKGSYGLGEISKDGKSVTLWVTFRFQQNGTRNLESED